ncbi:MAG: DUF4136 domain-containing protein [Bacteroidales bacterium]|nr:DUF4136 domain-containing protein [Bacteroidales bacterium]
MKIIKTKKILWYVALLVMPVIISSCYPGGAEYVDELDVVATRYDSEFNFTTAKTYLMPDTIMEIKDSDNPENNEPIRKDLNDLIISETAKQMQALGYERIFDTINGYPDIYLTISAVSTTYVGSYWNYWYGYWGWGGYWPPYYGPGWGWGYPGGVSYYSYETGTVIMNMSDPANADLEEKIIPVVWLAGLNGLLKGSNSYIDERVKRMIDQAFTQSPYL